MADIPKTATGYVPLIEQAVRRLEADYRIIELTLPKRAFRLFTALERPPLVRAPDGRRIPVKQDGYWTGGWDFMSALVWPRQGPRRKRRIPTCLCPAGLSEDHQPLYEALRRRRLNGRRVTAAEAQEAAERLGHLDDVDVEDLARFYVDARSELGPAEARSLALRALGPR